MGILRGGIIGVGGSNTGGSGGGFAGVISIESLSGIIDVDNTNGGLSISTLGQTIILNPLFSAASGAVLQDLNNDRGVRRLENLSGVIDIDSPDNSITISTSGQVIQLVVASGYTRVRTANFTVSDGQAFTVQHNLNTTEFVFNMWKTDVVPIQLVTPENVYPIDVNNIGIVLQVPINGKIVIVG